MVCLQGLNLAPKMGPPRPATHLCCQAGKQLCYFEKKIKPRIHDLSNGDRTEWSTNRSVIIQVITK